MTVDVHRLAANHTHLYPGATLKPIDDRPITADGTVLIEFADGEVIEGTILDEGDATILALDAHRTASVQRSRQRDGSLKLRASPSVSPVAPEPGETMALARRNLVTRDVQ